MFSVCAVACTNTYKGASSEDSTKQPEVNKSTSIKQKEFTQRPLFSKQVCLEIATQVEKVYGKKLMSENSTRPGVDYSLTGTEFEGFGTNCVISFEDGFILSTNIIEFKSPVDAKNQFLIDSSNSATLETNNGFEQAKLKENNGAGYIYQDNISIKGRFETGITNINSSGNFTGEAKAFKLVHDWQVSAVESLIVE